CCRCRVEQVCWDLVIGELGPPASIRVSCIRVENRYAQRAEIAGSFGSRRNSEYAGSPGATPRPLIISKKEQLVFYDRPPKRTTELVPPQRGWAVRLA